MSEDPAPSGSDASDPEETDLSNAEETDPSDSDADARGTTGGTADRWGHDGTDAGDPASDRDGGSAGAERAGSDAGAGGADDGAEAERAVDGAEAEGANDEDDPSIAGVFGARPDDAPPREDLVPESIDLENALFLLLGVLFGLFVVYRTVVVFTA